MKNSEQHAVGWIIWYAIALHVVWGLTLLFEPAAGNITAIHLIPQQFVLMMSAFGAIAAIMHSTFADGVPRPRGFILADQSPAVLAAAFHTAAIIERYVRRASPWNHGPGSQS